MANLLGDDGLDLQSSYSLAGRPFQQVVNRLDSLLLVLKSCKAGGCHEPWQTIHPGSKVKNLKYALDSDYDTFYKEQPKVSFSSCELGYLIDAEGPQHVNVWDEEQAKKYANVEQEYLSGKQRSFRYQGPNSWWT